MKWAVVVNSFKCGQNDIKTKWYQVTLHPNLPPYQMAPFPILSSSDFVERWLCSQREFLTFCLPVCRLCLQEPGDPEKLGEFLQKDNLSVHYFCLVSIRPPLLWISHHFCYTVCSLFFLSSLRSTTLFVFLSKFFLLKSIFWIVIYVPGIKS